MKNKAIRAKIIAATLTAALLAAPLAGCSTAPAAAKPEANASAAANAAASAAAAAPDAAQSAATVVNVTAQAQQTATAAAADGNPINLPGFAPIAEGFSLKSFSAQTLDGQTFTQDNFKDKDLTAINFWATTCPPCVNEMPDLAAFQQSLPENVAFITACLDADFSADAMNKILSDSGYNGITLVSGNGDFQNVANAVTSIPTTVFVNSDGVFVGGMVIGGGGDFSARFTDAINAILESMGKTPLS